MTREEAAKYLGLAEPLSEDARSILMHLARYRLQWCEYAIGIDKTHGREDPGSRAFWTCIESVNALCVLLDDD